ncbi:ATP-dependent helicase [Vibrio agarivorans]|uniref:ATP-dependent helicase n=1 Tax=Vibrio agarivorans TaxID=153622 RepID=UPI0025B30C67|nr:ATP-dependent helicase [Vibrio agarivorans]MDN3661055.1 ATP-dependent helicase [Vibrio agarivorans]
MNVYKGLTDRQEVAVRSEGVCNVIEAGAGAGKTAVLTRKVYLALQQYKGSNIQGCPVIAITFTRDAAAEMQERIIKMVGDELSQFVKATTFHSFAINHIIKPYIRHDFFQKHGLRKVLKLASDRDVLHCMAQGIEKGLPPKQRSHLKRLDKPTSFSEWLSLTRAFGFTPDSFFMQNKEKFGFEDIEEFLNYKEPLTTTSGQPKDIISAYYTKAWFRYVNELRQISNLGMIDFDEVLVLSTQFIEQHKDVRLELKSRYRALFVDEFQDTNNCQFRFVIALANDGSGLSLFGDIKQSIYGFRGSNPKLFTQVPQIFKKHNHIYLPDNFRSVPQIVAVGNALAENMGLKMSSEPMIAQNKASPIEPVTVFTSEDEQKEAVTIATKMQWLKDRGVGYHEMMVLYRYRKVANVLENELISRNIPCRRVGGSEDKSLYEDPRVQDIVLYLHLLFNPLSKSAMPRFLTQNRQFGLNYDGYRELVKANNFTNHHHMLQYLLSGHYSQSHVGYQPLSNLASDALRFSAKLENIKTFENYCRFRDISYEGLPTKQRLKVVDEHGQEYVKVLRSFIDSLMERYLSYFYFPFLTSERRAEIVRRERKRFHEDFRAITGSMYNPDRLFGEKLDIGDYLRSRPLLSASASKNKDDEENTTDVEFMTAHASKGLEKRVVFVIGCNEETWFKDEVTIGSATAEEELRLFYVAATRGKEQLYLSHYETQIVNGDTEKCNKIHFLPMINGVDNIKYITHGRECDNDGYIDQ